MPSQGVVTRRYWEDSASRRGFSSTEEKSGMRGSLAVMACPCAASASVTSRSVSTRVLASVASRRSESPAMTSAKASGDGGFPATVFRPGRGAGQHVGQAVQGVGRFELLASLTEPVLAGHEADAGPVAPRGVGWSSIGPQGAALRRRERHPAELTGRKSRNARRGPPQAPGDTHQSLASGRAGAYAPRPAH